MKIRIKRVGGDRIEERKYVKKPIIIKEFEL